MTSPPDDIVERITVDLRRNRLLLHLAEPLGGDDTFERPALIDVGASGRLLGVELGDRSFTIADPVPGTDHLTRSIQARVRVTEAGTVLVLPRRDDGYELSFPSGNQCWQRHGQRQGPASSLCATVAGSGPDDQ